MASRLGRLRITRSDSWSMGGRAARVSCAKLPSDESSRRPEALFIVRGASTRVHVCNRLPERRAGDGAQYVGTVCRLTRVQNTKVEGRPLESWTLDPVSVCRCLCQGASGDSSGWHLAKHLLTVQTVICRLAARSGSRVARWQGPDGSELTDTGSRVAQW